MANLLSAALLESDATRLVSDDVGLALLQADYQTVINHEHSKRLYDQFRILEWSSETDFEAVTAAIAAQLDDADTELRYHATNMAAACFQTFLQDNWTGPAVDDTNLALKPIMGNTKRLTDETTDTLRDLDPLQRALTEALSVDGETAYRWVRHPALLILARVVFVQSSPPSPSLGFLLFRLRTLMAHEQMLGHTTATLHASLLETAASIDGLLQDPSQFPEVLLNRGLISRVCLEIGLIHTHYRELSKAKGWLDRAKAQCGISFELSGALGKRTKFQQTAIAQPILNVDYADGHSKMELPAYCDQEKAELPKQSLLDDDTLLTEWHFEGDIQLQDQLPAHVQATIMAFCIDVENTNPRHGLTTEEMIPYVHRVLQQPLDFTIHTMALLTQARLEKARVRTLQRSCQQLATVADLYDVKTSAIARLRYQPMVCLPPAWKLQRELGRVYNTLGVYRDALAIFQRLELWDGVVACYQALDQDQRAEDLVRQRLAQEETPDLWCVLGDLKQDVSFFDKAWELSKGRSSRAMRSKGFMLLHKAERLLESHDDLKEGMYQASIEAFEKCLHLNSMQSDVLFSLGCCAQRVSDWPRVCRAFRRKVEIDEDDFESWNNLANGYVKTGEKRRAYFAFNEAAKQGYGNWKVWENLSAVAVDVGAFQDVFRSIDRIMDIQSSYNDYQVLSALVQAVNQDLEDIDGNKAGRLAPRLKQLCDRLRSVTVTEYRVWIAAAGFYNRQSLHAEAYDCRRSALQLVKQVKGWDAQSKPLQHVVACVEDIVEANETVRQLKQASASRLLVRSVCKQVMNKLGKDHEHQELAELQSRLEKAVAQTEELVATLKES
eukprot:m.120645 g.120645  ORF g.120645 m.120645 type:complete len:837 (-) comp15618_c0_seq1:53-2563(-)